MLKIRKFSGSHLAQKRKAKKLSQDQLALQLANAKGAFFHPHVLSAWENGRKPGADHLGLLSAVLGCKIDDFFA